MIAGAVAVVAAGGVTAGVVFTGPGGGTTSSMTIPVRTDPYGRLRRFQVYYRDLLADHHELVRLWRITYPANGGRRREAIVILPRWYGPRRHPPIPLVISPHGRGIRAADNVHFWGGLPAFGPFAVVNPEGQGRRLTLYSWGWQGQVDDLARMPEYVSRALAWLRLDRKRIYAVGTSMGGQEVLLLVARHPRLLAGASALDSATSMAARYREFPELRGGHRLQRLARTEIGGTPETVPQAYAVRGPLYWARRIALAGVPLHIWWSTRDRIVTNQRDESGLLYRLIKRADPHAPVTQYVGGGSTAKSSTPPPGCRLPSSTSA